MINFKEIEKVKNALINLYLTIKLRKNIKVKFLIYNF